MNRRARIMRWAFRVWMLRMGIAWAELWTGLVGVVTLGLISPMWTFRAMSRFHEFCISNPYPEK